MKTLTLEELEVIDSESAWPDEIAQVVRQRAAHGWRWLKEHVLRGLVETRKTPDGWQEVPLFVLFFTRVAH